MAKRKKPLINGYMRKKRGIFKRFSRATVKVKSGVAFIRMPERYTPKRPPKPDRRGTVFHDVPATRRLSVERTQSLTRSLEVMTQVDLVLSWTNLRHHGFDKFNFKELEHRGNPPYYWLRLYFHDNIALFVRFFKGEPDSYQYSSIYQGLHSAISVWKRFGAQAVKWRTE